MIGHRFSRFVESNEEKSSFERLLKVFLQLVTYTSGDVPEALHWLNELDREYGLTDDQYTMEDFLRDLKEKGYLKEPGSGGIPFLTPLGEQAIRKSSFEQLFGRLKRSKLGNHSTPFIGQGDETTGDLRDYRFGDTPDQISMTDSLRNAQVNHPLDAFTLQESDLEVQERQFKAHTSTVLMIDISHSMILYGEDRITPAKRVALALAELIRTRYPKDTLDIITFGDEAKPIRLKDLPYLQVGPFHTNTPAGLELAMDLLRRRKNSNKRIVMITDGKPSCMESGGRLYKNSFGLDRRIVNRCLNLAGTCRKLKIPITTFMVAEDEYLRSFIREFSEANGGKAYYTSLEGLGGFVLEDFEKNRKKKL
ncbi:MAG: vWA domain-containing protein [Bacteroidota bacterium]